MRHSRIEPELLSTVFVSSAEGTLAGSVAVTALVRADPQHRLDSEFGRETPCLPPDAPFEEVARLLADYNLTSIPVVEDHRMVGVVTVDDVLEAMLPRGWRRRFGLLGED